MHLTTEEVALAGVVIGGLIGSLSGSIRDRSNERRDHGMRIWEKEIEIYESLLLEGRGMQEIRSDIRAKFKGYGDGKMDFPFSGFDELTKKRLPIQLDMFGRSDVRAAYEECGRLVKELVIVLAQLVNSSRNIAEVEAGKLPEDQKISPEEVAGQMADLYVILDAGDEAERHLAKVISDAVQRVPTTGRKRPRMLFSHKGLPTSAVKIDWPGDR